MVKSLNEGAEQIRRLLNKTFKWVFDLKGESIPVPTFIFFMKK